MKEVEAFCEVTKKRLGGLDKVKILYHKAVIYDEELPKREITGSIKDRITILRYRLEELKETPLIFKKIIQVLHEAFSNYASVKHHSSDSYKETFNVRHKKALDAIESLLVLESDFAPPGGSGFIHYWDDSIARALKEKAPGISEKGSDYIDSGSKKWLKSLHDSIKLRIATTNILKPIILETLRFMKDEINEKKKIIEVQRQWSASQLREPGKRKLGRPGEHIFLKKYITELSEVLKPLGLDNAAYSGPQKLDHY